MSNELKDRVRHLFSYKDGFLYWNMDRGIKTKKGSLAGYFNKSIGRRNIMIDKKMYRYHRIIYLHHHGWMSKYVDHIDGDKLNNKIENLRSCTSSQNNYNRIIQKNNKSGAKGVHWSTHHNKWYARISVNKKPVYLGTYDNLDDAASAVHEGRKIHHKEFANNGGVD